MKKFEKIIWGLIIGSTFPLLLCMLSIFIWFLLDKSESRVLIYLSIGLSAGLIIDYKFLKSWIDKRYELPVWFILGIYSFYNICMYGMFMGFPVFNVFFSFLAGFYFGERILYKKIPAEKHYRLINQVSLVAGLIIFLICISSGFIALAGKGVGYDIQSMLGLRFVVTKSMILAITLIGGITLIILTIAFTRITMIITINKNSLPNRMV
jgi:hypothetical protein